MTKWSAGVMKDDIYISPRGVAHYNKWRAMDLIFEACSTGNKWFPGVLRPRWFIWCNGFPGGIWADDIVLGLLAAEKKWGVWE